MRHTALLVATLAIGVFGGAMEAAAQPSTGTEAAVRRADPRRVTMERLMRPATVDLSATPLEDVLLFIQQVGDIPLDPKWLDESGSYATGLDREAPVTMSVKNITMLALLERVLEATQTDFDGNAWQLTPDGVVEVGPKSRLNRSATLEIYDLSDLIFQVPDFPDVPELDLDTVLQQGSQRGGGGRGGGGIFQDPEELSIENMMAEERMRSEDIMNLIVTAIEPEQWDVNGGEGATMRLMNNQLLVRAPDYIHRQLAGYSYWPAGAANRVRTQAMLERQQRDALARSRNAPAAPAKAEPPAEQAESADDGQ